MPTVRFADKSIECPHGANLRVVLLRARLPLYTGTARALHCRGSALCGTCAVGIVGEVSEPTEAERRRLSLFPHRIDVGPRGRPERQRLVIQRIEVNPSLDDARFAMPARRPANPPAARLSVATKLT